jgi:hypothetical protein
MAHLPAETSIQTKLTSGRKQDQRLLPGKRPKFKSCTAHAKHQATQARTAALCELVLQASAPVIAEALGYSHTTTHKHLADAAGTWNQYPTARHNQRRQHPPSASPCPSGARP